MGSDAPIVPPSVEDNVRAASMRRREGMGEEESLSIGHSITDERVRSLHRPTAVAFQEVNR
jgi:hypothetical protein